MDDGAWLEAVAEMLAPEGAIDPARVDLMERFVATGAHHEEVAGLQPLTGVRFDQVPDRTAMWRAIRTIDTTSEARALRFVALFGRLFSGCSEHPLLAGIRSFYLFVEMAHGFVRYSSPETVIPLDLALVEDLLSRGSTPPYVPVLAGFSTTHAELSRWNEWKHTEYRETIRRFQGYDAAVARHAEVLRPCLVAADFEDRLAAIEALTAVTPETLRRFVPELATAITDDSGRVSTAAAALAAPVAADLVAPLQEIAKSGKPPARSKALRFLHALGDGAGRSWAETTAAADRAPAVRALLEEWAAEAAGPVSTAADPEVPPRPTIDWHTDIPEPVRQQLLALVADVNAEIEASNARREEELRRNPGGLRGPVRWPVPIEDVTGVLDDLVAGRVPTVRRGDDGERSTRAELGHRLERDFDLALLGFPGALALLAVDGSLLDPYGSCVLGHVTSRFWAAARTDSGPTPLAMAGAIEELGHDGGLAVLDSWAHGWLPRSIDALPDEEWADFVLTHLDKVLDKLPATEGEYGIDVEFPYQALAMLPRLPERAVVLLLDLGLRGPRRERRLAQDALAVVPDIAERVTETLADRDADVRREAATWLGRLRPASALAALERALAAERNDVATGAMLDALEALGRPVERYLDRSDLLAQAEKLVARGLPAVLRWFPWSALPEVRWSDSGEPVDVVVVQWMLAQAVKARSPQPNAVLRRYCAMFEPAGREALGQHVLEEWIAEDLQAGSAAASKGVLAVVGACAGGAAAPVIGRYLRSWYARRHAQAKALIQALAWIDHPAAIQLLLSVGSGFPARSLQKEATAQAEALAERKGWSVLELADRTIPTAGFDEHGRLELPYGERVFTARLLPDLTCRLVSPEGAVIRSLPTPRRSDDPEQAALSKKVYAAAKRELKDLAAQLARRLHDAMCAGRTWPADVWSTYLDRHPAARFLTQRLVWSATSVDGTVTLFRPLGDGTLTGVDDEPVELADGDVVGIAHVVTIGAEAAAEWRRHLDDYEVVPLLRQLDNPPYPLVGDLARETAVRDLEGHLISAYALRGRATKCGYRRGPAEDGAVFTTYVRGVTGVDLTVVIGFSGSMLPEEDRTVALVALRFERADRRGRTSAVPLGEVPPVLLAEAYADLRHAAAGGTGFDPDWRSKVEW